MKAPSGTAKPIPPGTRLLLGAAFFGLLTPIAWLLRLFGYDPLRQRRSAPSDSYWVAREPGQPAPTSMKRQA